LRILVFIAGDNFARFFCNNLEFVRGHLLPNNFGSKIDIGYFDTASFDQASLSRIDF